MKTCSVKRLGALGNTITAMNMLERGSVPEISPFGQCPALHWNKEKSALRPRPHSADFQLKKEPKGFLFLESNCLNT